MTLGDDSEDRKSNELDGSGTCQRTMDKPAGAAMPNKVDKESGLCLTACPAQSGLLKVYRPARYIQTPVAVVIRHASGTAQAGARISN